MAGKVSSLQKPYLLLHTALSTSHSGHYSVVLTMALPSPKNLRPEETSLMDEIHLPDLKHSTVWQHQTRY